MSQHQGQREVRSAAEFKEALFDELRSSQKALVDGWLNSSQEVRAGAWRIATRDAIETRSDDPYKQVDPELVDTICLWLFAIECPAGDAGRPECESLNRYPAGTVEDNETILREVETLISDYFDRDEAPGKGRIKSGVRFLLDLTLGPIRFDGRVVEERQGKPLQNKKPALGLMPAQAVFLGANGERPDGTSAEKLDEFAVRYVLGQKCDGVTLLAGERGSGKSTLLNRIAMFANHWDYDELDERKNVHVNYSPPPDWRPLLVHVDLGSRFEGLQTATDLMREICRATELHVSTKPVQPWSWMWPVTRLFGHLGNWCRGNLAWAMTAGLLAAALLFLHYYARWIPRYASITQIAVVTYVAAACGLIGVGFNWIGRWKNKSTRISDSRWTLGVLLGLVLPLTLLPAIESTLPDAYKLIRTRKPQVAHVSSFADLIGRQLREQITPRTPKEAVQLEDAIRLIADAYAKIEWNGKELLTLDYADLSLSDPKIKARLEGLGKEVNGTFKDFDEDAYLTAFQTQVAWDYQPTTPLNANIVTLGGYFLLTACCLTLAMAFLPTWWWDYLYCRSVAAQIRRQQEAPVEPTVPFLSSILSILGSLFPRSAITPVRDLGMPFLMEELKRLLQHCRHGFRDVIILVDDLDVLPMRQFPELLQILRPVTKVDGVRCVMTGPVYLYHALRVPPKDDLYSTIRYAYLVGDAAMNNLKGSPAGIRGLSDAELKGYMDVLRGVITGQVRSRLLLPCQPCFTEGPDVRAIADGATLLGEFVWLCWSRRTGKARQPGEQLTEDELESLRATIHKQTLIAIRELDPNRRELLRETDRLLRSNQVTPFDDRHVQETARNDFRTAIARYRRSEEKLVTVPEIPTPPEPFEETLKKQRQTAQVDEEGRISARLRMEVPEDVAALKARILANADEEARLNARLEHEKRTGYEVDLAARRAVSDEQARIEVRQKIENETHFNLEQARLLAEADELMRLRARLGKTDETLTNEALEWIRAEERARILAREEHEKQTGSEVAMAARLAISDEQARIEIRQKLEKDTHFDLEQASLVAEADELARIRARLPKANGNGTSATSEALELVRAEEKARLDAQKKPRRRPSAPGERH